MTNRGGIDGAELRQALSVSKAIESALSAFRTNAASLIAKMERHGDGGTGVLAETAGLSRREAIGQVKNAEAIAEAPSVRDAVEQGRVSQANARRLAEAVQKTSADAVEADAGLLAKAESLRPEQFAKEARRWAADRQDDGGEREYQRLRAKRCVHVWDAEDGTVQLHGTFDPVTGRRIGKRLNAEARRMYEADKKQASGSDTSGRNLPAGGRNRNGKSSGHEHVGGGTGERGSGNAGERRTLKQCMADALDNLTADPHAGTGPGIAARGADASSGQPRDLVNGTGQPVDPPVDKSAGEGSTAGTGAGRSFADISVIAHVDNSTGELIAELSDGARLPEAVLEELACNARLTGLVYSTAGTPIWRANSTRTATEGQRRLLLNHWGGCFHCAADPAMCQIHHIVPVSRGGATKIDNMVPVCWDCHHKIHHYRWQVRKRPDGRHSLHPPNSRHHGPAHAPEQPLLFTTSDSDDRENPDHQGTPPRSSGSGVAAATVHEQVRAGPVTARAALGPRP